MIENCYCVCMCVCVCVCVCRLCSHHREKVSVYCETCRLCICHECVLWENSPHHNHTFIKLEVLLQKQTKICEAQVIMRVVASKGVCRFEVQ